MLDADTTDNPPTDEPAADAAAPRKRAPRKRAAKAAPDPAPADAGAAVSTEAAAEPTANPVAETTAAPPRKRAPRKAAKKTAAAAEAPVRAGADAAEIAPADGADASAAPARKTARKSARKTARAAAEPSPDAAEGTAAEEAAAQDTGAADSSVPDAGAPDAGAPGTTAAPAKKTRKRATKKAAPAAPADADADATAAAPTDAPALAAPGVLFMAPVEEAPAKRTRKRAPTKAAAEATPDPEPTDADLTTAEAAEDSTAEPEDVREAAIEQASGARRRRRRGRRGRGGNRGAENGEADESADTDTDTAEADAPADEAPDAGEGSTTTRRRRRRRSGAADADGSADDPPNTVVHVREPKQESRQQSDDGVRGVKGSTRLEAKRQRRRDGRETTRRRAPVLTEAEFLARREAVDRVMAVRQNGERTQIAVLEDGVLVEHYVTRASATSYVGNVYLGRVQNVLPSMEAAFVDIGKGRNGVLYAGEVNWDAAGLEGKSRAIEHALKSGDSVLVQVTKDPIGHKGARLTSQISLPGRFLVYVPGGGMTGISRRLPDTERHRLKSILKKIVPDEAGVIVRTAAEGASEEDLTRDVERLTAQWEQIEKAAQKTSAAPVLVHGEPDLAIRVVRDVFNEDFKKLVVQGESAWETVSEYVSGVAPDLADRVGKHTGTGDLFHDLRVDEQLMKALDRKVWLPSGGSLVIDRTEAMTVIDVNTGKFVGSGGNLEQTVTRNNLEAAEEIVRQLRLRDVGGIVVIDFIDMVLESNRDLVLRRLTECLGRDRTKHQVAEVTSLGLVQMTRKRVGEGLLEAFSETCPHCNGRGVLIHSEPIDKSESGDADDDGGSRARGKRKRGGRGAAAATGPAEPAEPPASDEQRKAANAAIAAIHRAAHGEGDDDGEPGGLVDELASGLVAAAARDAAGGSAPQPDGRSDSAPAGPDSAPAAARELGASVVADVAVTEDGPAPRPQTTTDGGSAPEADSVPVADAAPAPRRRRRAASRPAGPPSGS